MGPTANCYILPQRDRKTRTLMMAFAEGCGGRVIEDPKDFRDDAPAVVWGQIWESADIMRLCTRIGLDFYQIDNGYFHAARGKIGPEYFYRITKNGLCQNWIWHGVKPDRWHAQKIELKPWRATGKVILLAIPGRNFGTYMGLDMDRWAHVTYAKLINFTKRRVVVREKQLWPPLTEALKATCVLVTHASNAAVEAIVEGVPVICDPMCAAAPVARTRLEDLERPYFCDREPWARSLAMAQFSLPEMRDGTAWKIIKANPGPPKS